MTDATKANAVSDLLCDLIAIHTVNPMGRDYTESAPVERPVIEYLEHVFAPFDVQCRRIPCSPIHESLLVSIPGAGNAPGVLFESHIDTVPADDWADRAFQPRREAGKVIGRGACDDKGSLAAMVLALLEIIQSGELPPQPLLLLAAGDEEYGQTGVKSFLELHRAPLACGIFGEPTNCIPVIQHKGTIRWDITAHGRSAHSSKPFLGRNAILDMMRVCQRLQAFEAKLQTVHTNELTGGPTLTVTMIHGGRTRNVVPDECTIAVDLRVAPGMDGAAVVEEIFADLRTLGLDLSHQPFQCFAPALNTPLNDPFVARVGSICREVLGADVTPAGVPYGSDAGWIPAGVPAVVLGPGDIAVAHAIDEFVDVNEVVHCAAIYQRIAWQHWSSPS